MRRRIILFLVFLTAFPMFSGCWSRNEVETLAIVTGMGIDQVKKEGKDQFLLTLNIVRPSLAGGGTEGGRGKGQPIFWRVSAVGNTLAEAEELINLRVPRRVFYGHLKFVLINQDVAKQGIADVIDYLHRNRSIRPRVFLLLTEKKASEVFLSFPEMENTISRQVEEIERMSGNRESQVKIVDLSETTDEMITPGFDPVIARVTTQESAPTEPGGKPIQVLRFTGGGALKLDKLVGWLNDKETRGYLLARGQAQHAAFSIQSQQHPTDNLSITMTHSSGKISVKPEGSKIIAQIRIRAEGDLTEYHEPKSIATKSGLNQLEKIFEKIIKHDVEAAIKKAQKLDADIFGFGVTLHRSHPRDWKKVQKDWYKILPKVEVEVQVKADIRRTGIIAEPFKPE